MIISASRRTDIPAFYSEWFFERIKEGYALVRNPMNPCQVSRIPLNREAVDCIIFWTKDPAGMLPCLGKLDGYSYYFQFTLNPYDTKIEPGVPAKPQAVETFKRLSDMIGSQRMIWRYDPVILTGRMDTGYHIRCFEALAGRLAGYTEKCILSFVDPYQKIQKNLEGLGARETTEQEKHDIAANFAQAARSYSLKLETCAEAIDLSQYGIGHARCIDPDLIPEITGKRITAGKDRNQRKECGCAGSTDIGAYNTCRHGCLYCYANYSPAQVTKTCAGYDVHSPLLCSTLSSEDVVKEKQADTSGVLESQLRLDI